MVADDHHVIRAGLRRILAQDPRLDVVGEASDGSEVVALLAELQPDMILMDARMPGMDGLEATRIVKQRDPTVTVLILTLFEDPRLMLEAARAGAAGFVLKSATAEALLSAIWQGQNGGFASDPKLLRRALMEYSNRRLATESPPPAVTLSARELEVLELIARGQSNPRIAEELYISPSTVKVHVEHILAKLGVSDRTQAAVRAIELGYVRSSKPRGSQA
jgi:DNA-binding NarL/FixJ family response regulator